MFIFSLKAEDLRLNAIYGKDNRAFITNSTSTNSLIKSQASVVAMIVSKETILERGKTFLLDGNPLKESLNLCTDEKFSSKPSVVACTGFLVKPNVLVTAGHCIADQSDCENKKIIFDVLDSSNKMFSSQRKIKGEQIFSCKKILYHGISSFEDFSVVELDRKIINKKPLELNMDLGKNRPKHVYMIGHPYGLSLMYAQAALVSEEQDRAGDNLVFKASLDSFEGNSGSPVFNLETNKVEGLLINGQDDLFFDSQNKCYRYSVYNGVGGEGILKISSILPHIINN